MDSNTPRVPEIDEHEVELSEPESLERTHTGEALRLLGRSPELFEPFTTLLAA